MYVLYNVTPLTGHWNKLILMTAFYSNEVTPKLKALQHHKDIWCAM